jgi:hypothetical protein
VFVVNLNLNAIVHKLEEQRIPARLEAQAACRKQQESEPTAEQDSYYVAFIPKEASR